MSKSHNIKTTYLAMLMQIGEADGNLDILEEKYIDHLSERLGISSSEKILIKQNPAKYCTQLPDTYAQRIEFFYNLLFMMGIDNKITKAEKELTKRIGFKLCFNPMLMDDLVNIMVENIGQNVPVEEVIKAVIKYQN